MDRQHGVRRSLAPTEGEGRDHRAPRSTPHGHKAGPGVSGRGGHGEEAAPCAHTPKLRVTVCPAGLRSEKGLAQPFLECPWWAGPDQALTPHQVRGAHRPSLPWLLLQACAAA